MISATVFHTSSLVPSIIKSDNFGHIDKKIVIPIGTKAKIDTEDKIKIELVEPCVD